MLILIFDTEQEKCKFELIYEKYKKYVMYTIKRFICDDFLVEDLFHDVFILIANHLDNINMEQEKETKNFIITITRHYTINHLKKQNHIKEVSLEEQVQEKDILDEIVVKEAMEKLKQQIHMLDEKYKTVLELKYIIGFTDNEIAELLGITKKNVQIRLYRAKNLLRSKLGEKDV